MFEFVERRLVHLGGCGSERLPKIWRNEDEIGYRQITYQSQGPLPGRREEVGVGMGCGPVSLPPGENGPRFQGGAPLLG